MKSLSAPELVSFCEWLRERLQLAQLQDLWTDGKFFVLQFYSKQELFLVIDLQPQAPVLWLQEHKPKVVKSPKPVSLFLSAHAKGRRLQALQVLLDRGRSVLLVFSATPDPCEVQIDLIPRHPNLCVSAIGKQVFWNKPIEPPPVLLPELTPIERDWAAWCAEISLQKFSSGSGASGPKSGGEGLARALEKKQKAVAALQEQLRSDQADRYRALGEALKISNEAPGELADLFDSKKSVSENRERAFQKAKDLVRKKDGTRDRLAQLQQEIQDLQERLGRGESARPAAPSVASRLMKKGEAQGRKIQLEGGLEAALGKSGADNLALLRQARAWDLWIHLKDEPGAHAILFRNRGQEVPDTVIRQVSEWVWRESKGKKAILGGKYQVLVVECRYVKPIKGDRLGRVNYTNPRVYTFASKSNS